MCRPLGKRNPAPPETVRDPNLVPYLHIRSLHCNGFKRNRLFWYGIWYGTARVTLRKRHETRVFLQGRIKVLERRHCQEKATTIGHRLLQAPLHCELLCTRHPHHAPAPLLPIHKKCLSAIKPRGATFYPLHPRSLSFFRFIRFIGLKACGTGLSRKRAIFRPVYQVTRLCHSRLHDSPHGFFAHFINRTL